VSAKAEQALLLGHVEQFVFDAEAAGPGIEHAADDDVILVERAPGRIVDLTAARGLLDDVADRQRTELARTGEIGAHHFGQIGLRRRGAALVGHRNDGDRQGRGIAADDVDLEPLLGHRGQGQQEGEQ